MDKSVMVNVCRVSVGHNMITMQTGMIKDPKNDVLIPQFEIICTRCGGNLDQISEEVRTRRSSGKRKPKEAATVSSLSSPPAPIGIARQEEEL